MKQKVNYKINYIAKNGDKEVLIETIDLLNQQVKEYNNLKEGMIEQGKLLDNTKKTLYLIIGFLSKIDNKENSSRDINLAFGNILHACALGIRDIAIDEVFDKEDILKGQIAAIEYTRNDCNCPKCRENNLFNNELEYERFNRDAY